MLKKTEKKELLSYRGNQRTLLRRPNAVDEHVGRRIHMRRRLLGWDQKKLAQKLGISFQQLQKYEQGINRLSASRLWDMSMVLGVSVNFFFEDMNEQTNGTFLSLEDIRDDDEWIMNKNETMELVEGYYRIPNRDTARRIFTMINLLAELNVMEVKDVDTQNPAFC